MKCKNCNKNFHYCSSCYGDKYEDNGYCSEKCFVNSDEYSEVFEKVSCFYNALDFNLQREFSNIWHNIVMENELYEDVFNFIIEKNNLI